MSFQALAWASKQHVSSASEKLMLLAYADRHNEETGCGYPSIAWLCEFSSLNRKTVIAAVARLEAANLLTDTGDRKGETKQIKVYRVNVDTVPKAEQSQKRNSPKNHLEQSQKRDTDTVRTINTKKAKASLVKRATALPANFTPHLVDKCAAIVDLWPPGMLEREIDQFRDRHIAHGTLSKDWQASFRTWVRNAEKWRDKNGKRPSHSEFRDPILGDIARSMHSGMA